MIPQGERQKQKQETRSKILSSAAKLFTKNGFAATGIDAVMEGAGRTAGGFYSHFKSKNELLTETLKNIFENSGKMLREGVSADPRKRRKEILERYLSKFHRDTPEKGCPLVGIAAELGRYGKETSQTTAHYVERMIQELVASGLSRTQAISEVSRSVGALLLARIVKGEPLSDEILDEMREVHP